MINLVVVSSDLQPHVFDTRLRVCWERLSDPSVRGVFNFHLRESFNQILREVGDIESEQTMFSSYIVDAAIWSCGRKVSGAGRSGNPQKQWWTLEVRDAVKLKKESYRAWLARGTPEAAEAYWQAKQTAAWVVSKQKLGVRWWKEYFEDLLNSTDTPSIEEPEAEDSEVDSFITQVEITEVVQQLLGSKAPGVDEIHPEYLKSLDIVGLSWLTCLCNIAWQSGTVPLDWVTGVVVPLFKKGDRKVCSNYRGITLLSLPGKVYSRVLERRVRPLVEPRIQEEQCGFYPGRGTLDQFYTLHRVLKGSWEFSQPVHMCFVDLEKTFDCVLCGILWWVLWEYGVCGPLLRAVRSLYNRSRSLVCIASCKSDLFPVHVGLQQGCPLSPVLFIVFMDRISRRSQWLEGFRFGDHRISSLIFADDVVLLAPSSLDLQHALGHFAAECEAAGMRVSTSKSEAMVGGEFLPQVEEFKYLWVLFTSEGRMDREIDRWIGAAESVMRSMYRSVVVKKELSRKAKLSIYLSIYIPTLTYGHELWVMTENIRSRIQSAKMSFLRRVAGRSLRDRETRWKGSKACSIGAGFKLFYYGVDSKRNGGGVVLKEEFVRNVLEVKRVSDRVMSLKLEIEGVMLNVVSGYAPKVGCELEEKERFWSELDEVMESIPTGERVVIGADFNGHVGEGNTGDEEVMGKFGVKERNLEGQMVGDFAKRMDMAVVNTYFQKREEHRVTYKSGGRRTQVDYILCRRGNLKEISDCKVVVGESVARQHRMVVCRMTLMVCKKKRSKIEIEKKTKWWKLKKEECCEEFRQKLRQALGGQVVLPDDWETTAEVIRETGRKVLGVSSGRRKRLAKKKWDMDKTEENRQEYKELQRRVKREVSKAKQKAYDELYTRLDTREGEKGFYWLARQRD
ncbi:hypothetical protein QTP70_003744 [Hemibagrus guttatus]|uniref:Reverse transcriptase domain-containing protein n=1 Tax=Hemibagrus guttatus TaxID=175788 RepID=A0AAE0QNX1_9TELE|nr:hypothetical protein QTP70_003744 [Hemibagrus guttatus]